MMTTNTLPLFTPACCTKCDAMTEHYYHLRDYALEHTECSAIMHIID